MAKAKSTYKRREYLHDIFAALHSAQYDKNKKPYIYHLEAVSVGAEQLAAQLGLTEQEQEEVYVAGLGHDSEEDCAHVTTKENGWLHYFGCTAEERRIIAAVSKTKGANNAAYITQVIDGGVKPMIVKYADLKNNTEEERLRQLETTPVTTYTNTTYKPAAHVVKLADGTEISFTGYEVDRLLKKYVPAIDRIEEKLGLPRTYETAYAWELREKQITTTTSWGATKDAEGFSLVSILNLAKNDMTKDLGTVVSVEKNMGNGPFAPVVVTFKKDDKEASITFSRTAEIMAKYSYSSTTASGNTATSSYVFGPRTPSWVKQDDQILKDGVEYKVRSVIVKTATNETEFKCQKLSALSKDDPFYTLTYKNDEKVTAKMKTSSSWQGSTGSSTGSTTPNTGSGTVTLSKAATGPYKDLEFVLWPVYLIKEGDIVEHKGKVTEAKPSVSPNKTLLTFEKGWSAQVCGVYSDTEEISVCLKQLVSV